MKRLTLLILILGTISVSAQHREQARIDSLLAELPHVKQDSSRLKLLINLMTFYNDFNGDEGLKYEKQALDLARKLNSKTSVADVKNAVGRIYWRKGNVEQGLRYHNEAKKIFEDAGNKKKAALTVRYIGQDYADGGNYPEALDYFSKALAMYKKMDDYENMAYMHNFLSWVYNNQGNYVKASECNYAALQLFEKIGDQHNIANTLAAIGSDYVYLRNYTEALKYFMKSTRIYKAQRDNINMAYNHNALGNVYKLMGNYSEAEKCHSFALGTGLELNNPNIMADAYDGMADVSKLEEDYSKALSDYLSSAELFKKWANKKDLARVYCKIGDCYRLMKKYDESKKYFDDAFEIFRELESKALLVDYYHGMEMLDSATGNWKAAYINYKSYIANRDSVFNQDNTRKMVQLQMTYEFDKREAASKAEQEQRDIRQRVQFISLGVIAALILTLTVVLYRNQRQEALINLELKQKSESLEEENRQKTSILNIVSHDLQGPFNKIQGLTDIMLMTKDLNKEDKEQYIAHIKSSIDQGNYLIKNLLESQAAQNVANEAVFETIDLEKFIYNFQQVIYGLLHKKQQYLNTQIDLSNKKLYTDPQMLTRILDNLVSNASKFSDFGKPIFLRIWPEEKSLNFSIRDEGPGISEEDQKKMYKKFQMLSARPTAGEGSAGLGLSIAKALVEKLNGSISVHSKLGEGTEFVISFLPPA